MRRVDSLEKTDGGRDWGQEEKGMTEDEMAGWHHRLDGHEFGWTPGASDGQGGLECCSSWGHKESDMTEGLIWSEAETTTTKKDLILALVVCLLFSSYELHRSGHIKGQQCSSALYIFFKMHRNNNWTGRPGVLWFTGLQRIGHDWATELNWTEWFKLLLCQLHHL